MSVAELSEIFLEPNCKFGSWIAFQNDVGQKFGNVATSKYKFLHKKIRLKMGHTCLKTKEIRKGRA